jgi:hypothetical protein
MAGGRPEAIKDDEDVVVCSDVKALQKPQSAASNGGAQVSIDVVPATVG